MKTIFRIGSILAIGLLAFAIFKYWLQPRWVAARMQVSIEDCVFAANVGAAGAGNVEFSPDGQLLAISSNSRRSILNAETGDLVCDFATAKEKTNGFCFSADSKRLAYADRSIIRIKSIRGELTSEIDISNDGAIDLFGQIIFTPNQKGVAFTSNKGICVYDKTGKKQSLYATKERPKALHMLPKGKSLIACDWKGTIYKWDVDTNQLAQTKQAHEEYLVKSALSGDGQLLATLGRDHSQADGAYELKLWHPDDLSLIHAIDLGKKVTDLSFDKQAEHLLISKSTGEAMAIELQNYETIKIWQMPRGISTSTISPSGNKVCFGLSKRMSTIDTNTHRDLKGYLRQRRDGKPIPYQTIKGQSVSPGVVLVLESKFDRDAETTPSEM